MTPLEQLFRLEIEFHRRLRTEAPGTGDARSLHTSYALQAGYEPLLAATGRMTGPELKALKDRMLMAGDARDVMAASDSLRNLLGIPQFDAP